MFNFFSIYNIYSFISIHLPDWESKEMNKLNISAVSYCVISSHGFDWDGKIVSAPASTWVTCSMRASGHQSLYRVPWARDDSGNSIWREDYITYHKCWPNRSLLKGRKTIWPLLDLVFPGLAVSVNQQQI